MATPVPQDPGFEERVRKSFLLQRVMKTIGARMLTVAPGVVEIEIPYHPGLTQQDGYLHAGIVTTIADSACGYAAYTLLPADVAVLTVEFKVNLLAPAKGERFVARGRVLRSGRTLTVCQADVVAYPSEQTVATMLGTIMALRPRKS
jgi:uncharacterized protein (TIGR00369 family)